LEGSPTSTTPSPRLPLWSERVEDLLGGVLLGIGIMSLLPTLGSGVSAYDEGILLTNSRLVQVGLLPHRDFYTNYPPGIYLLIAAVWSWIGVSPLAVRLLSGAVHLTLALLTARLAGRALGRSMSLLSAGLVMCWLSLLDPVSYSWLLALAVALLALELGLSVQAGGGPGVQFACGVAFGSVSCLRHDLFVYMTLAGAVALALAFHGHRRPARRTVLAVLAGAAVPLLLVWGPIVVQAGWWVADDLFITQVRHVQPARQLPLPALWGPTLLPRWLIDPFASAVALTLVAPLLAFALVVGAGGLRLAGRWTVGLLGGLSLAVLPQMLGRTDLEHAVFTIAPGVTLATILAQASARRWRSARLAPWLLTAVLVTPLLPALYWRSLATPTWPTGGPPFYGMPVGDARRRLVEFIASKTRPGEPIYVGAYQHRLLVANEIDLYFFADRPSATRYMQFDPNLQTRADVQRTMIADLERHRTRLVVLTPCCWFEEPNESRLPGSDELDRYIRERYALVAQFGNYLVLWRRELLPAERETAPGNP